MPKNKQKNNMPKHKDTKSSKSSNKMEYDNEREFEELVYDNNGKIEVVDIHNTPKYLIDNEYIYSGYRVNFNSKLKILKR